MHSTDAGDAVRQWTPDGFLARAWHALDVALQPIVDTGDASVYAYEALMRGFTRLGLESIGQVLDLAFELGVADRLHMLMLEKALQKHLVLAPDQDRKLFYNLDGRAITGSANLIEKTEALLDSMGVLPSVLCLEFSETYNYASAALVAELVRAHRERGGFFAIDDFGRGISELQVIYEYHPEIIKLDRFFVADLPADRRKLLFVTTIVNLAHVLGIRVVAEGIERVETWEACVRIGVDLAQGFLIAPPQLATAGADRELTNLRLLSQRGRSEEGRERSGAHRRIEKLQALAIDTPMYDVFRAFREQPGQSLFPIVDRSGEPRGIVVERDLREFIYSPYGRDLLQNDRLGHNLAHFATACPVADIDLPATALLDAFTGHPNTEGVVVTENGRYVGFLSAASLLEIATDLRIEAARDQNPLTKLPGNMSVDRTVDELVRESAEDRFLCYFDFDNFKPFNDLYGFRVGDRAIVMFAGLLRGYFADARFLVGHIGGDDFFVGASGVEEADLLQLLEEVKTGFASDAQSLYTNEDRARGSIEAQDRYGNVRQFPLLDVSIAVLSIARGERPDSTDRLVHEIMRLKRVSKRSSAGLVVGRYGDVGDDEAWPADGAAG